LTAAPSETEVVSYFQTLSNWGRWGTDDELGTLNLITPETRRAAVALVSEGVSIGCARPIVIEPPAPDVPRPPLHFMIASGESPATTSSSDFLGLSPHGMTISHVDALAHFFWQDKAYNDRPRTIVTTAEGATACSVETMQHGIVTRGVLLDIARLKDKPYLEAGEGIFPEDLEAAERAQGVRIDRGDALLLRTGWYRRRNELGPYPIRGHRPGLHAATLPWLHERGVALVAADASHDAVPSGYEGIGLPVHSIGIVAMGLCLIDACQFDELAAHCERLQRWKFLFVVAPIRFRFATASPVTPIAIL